MVVGGALVHHIIKSMSYGSHIRPGGGGKNGCAEYLHVPLSTTATIAKGLTLRYATIQFTNLVFTGASEWTKRILVY